MTTPAAWPVPFRELPRSRRRRLVLQAVVGPSALAVATVLVYYRLPLDGGSDRMAITQLVLGLAVVAGLSIWQTRAVLRSDHPEIQTVQALAATVPLFIVLYSSAYVVMSLADPASFTEALSRTDALYFTVTVLSTVGLGDISPVSTAARVLVTTQMLADLLLIGVAVKVFFRAARTSSDRRRHGRSSQRGDPAGDDRV